MPSCLQLAHNGHAVRFGECLLSGGKPDITLQGDDVAF
jgi:hypothetical protein